MVRFVLLLCMVVCQPLVAHSLSSGSQAPEWELRDVHGQPHRLADWRGQWILLKLGTTQCPNCTRETAEMEKIQADLEDLGVQILDIFLGDEADRVQRYLQKHPSGLDRLVLYDPKGVLARPYGISIVPHLFLVDPGGVVRWQARFTAAAELLKSLREEMGATPYLSY